MQQVVHFFWICGVYVALSVVMAYLVAAYDPRRPQPKHRPLPAASEATSEHAASRQERSAEEGRWCLGLRDGPISAPRPAVVGAPSASWLQTAVQHATGVRLAAAKDAKYSSWYSKAVLVVGPPKQQDANDWNRLLMGFILNFKGPMIGIHESTLAKDPRGQLQRALQFLGHNASGIDCAVGRTPALVPGAASVLTGDAKDKWDMVLNTLKDSSIQVQ